MQMLANHTEEKGKYDVGPGQEVKSKIIEEDMRDMRLKEPSESRTNSGNL